ncbi:hypothetical protein ED208_11305 [Stagnimonas aquatica]|uniref:Transcription factor zinc-finger domain-containing protein n=1 Tax=Stagnimonas aquatica TaxID=2689987 RepID=A0A3N0VAM2_9GAMM|nr:zf-TFIIB domain-containing protein [Stagnimonas aquatica]ROH89702.1 hypothetical protein ED208_11305 [Stagnimonas aquatica]
MSETLNIPALRGTGLICPACQVALVMSERQNIEIDYCPACRGVWLDRGELDKIIERSQGTPSEPPLVLASGPMKNSYPVDEGHRGRAGHDGGHRRKSWLQELFD